MAVNASSNEHSNNLIGGALVSPQGGDFRERFLVVFYRKKVERDALGCQQLRVLADLEVLHVEVSRGLFGENKMRNAHVCAQGGDEDACFSLC